MLDIKNTSCKICPKHSWSYTLFHSVVFCIFSLNIKISAQNCEIFKLHITSIRGQQDIIRLQKSIKTEDITWYFNKDCTTGVFANGDYWVKGPVVIDSITPSFDGTNNGWEVNPVVEGGQGFQDGCSGGNFDPALVPKLPFTADPDKYPDKRLSIVKTTSSGGNRPCINTAAVLTVVSEIPPENGAAVFRPPYVGDQKPYYYVDSIKKDLLPNYQPVNNTPTLNSVRNNFSKFRMDHKPGVLGRSLRPKFSMNDYQPANTAHQNEAAIRFMLNDPYEQKKPALTNFLQFGIDHVHTMFLGQRWPAGGGHQPGHLIVIAFTAVMLDIEEAKKILREAAFFHGSYFFYVGKHSLTLWGEKSSENGYWSYITDEKGSRSQKDPYELIDGGIAGEAYQLITSQSHKGEILATHLMPVLKEAWNPTEWKIVQNYTDRWVLHGVWTLPDPYAPFDGIKENYGITYGPDKNTGDGIRGAGRFANRHGNAKDGGQYRSAFIASMWDTYRTSVPGADTTPPFAVIISPLDSQEIVKKVDVSVCAFGIHGVKSVQLYIDDQLIGTTETISDNKTNIYAVPFDPGKTIKGNHLIWATLTDNLNNSKSDTISVIVK